MSNKRTFYPSRTFDEDLTGLVDLFKSKGWSFAGTDTQQLIADAATQRDERLAHDQLESQYLNLHEQFGVNQEQRYERFATALNTARAAFGKDKAIMAELNRFKRSVRRSKKTDPPQEQ